MEQTEQLTWPRTNPELNETAMAERISDALLARLSLRHVKVIESAAGYVILKGRVPSYYLKQVVQETVMAFGVDELRNDIEVVSLR